MSESALGSSANHLHSGLQNSNLSAVIAAACPREVVRCHQCLLVQFRTLSDLCRRCAGPLPQHLQPGAESAMEPGHGETTARISVRPSARRDALHRDPRPRLKTARELALGHKLKALRESRNLTQEQISATAGVPRTYISRIENSRLLPGPAMLHRLASALGVGIPDLLSNSGNGDSGSAEDVFWNSLVRYFRQLRPEHKAAVLYRVRGMLCERLQRQYRSERQALG